MPLPNFFIAGVPKAGTSSVFTWLAAHPQTLGSTEKETCFFADPESHIFRPDFNVLHGLEAYAKQFPFELAARADVIFEATPAYVYQQTALAQIPDLPTRPKCLFVLREPAAQIASIHRYFQNNWSMIPADMGFAEYLAAVRAGSHDFAGNELARDAIFNACYADHLEKWADRLGDDRMKILLFEEVVQNPRNSMREISSWLGIDPDFYQTYGFPNENESYEPKSRTLQKVNIALRGVLPKGRLYEKARDLYRRANTRAPAPPDDADRTALADLKSEFADANQRLSAAFGLDLSAWSV